MDTVRPLLLVDVDGVISLFGFDPASPPAGSFEVVDGIHHYLSASAGEHLRRLSSRFELAWCTGGEEEANEYLVPPLSGTARALSAPPRASGSRARAHWRARRLRPVLPVRAATADPGAGTSVGSAPGRAPALQRRVGSRPSPPPG